MTTNTQKQVVVLPGPTGPRGLLRGVNILPAFTGPTGAFPVWGQLAGFTGPTGTFETVYDAGGVAGLPTVIIPGYTGGGGGGGYVAKAVRLGGAAWLNIASLTAIDNTFYSFVGWYKMSAVEFNLGNNLFVTDPDGNYTPAFLPGHTGPTSPFGSGLSLQDATTNNYENAYSTDAFPADRWNCVIVSIDTTAQGVGKFYLGDTDVTASAGTWASGGSFPFTNPSNGKRFTFGNDGGTSFVQADVADWRVMPGVSLLDGGGSIPLATRRLFIDAGGKPVDPATATAALGAAGAVLFSGDHTTFATNQGTGGAFTLTGSLTNATTSPSD